MVRTRFLIIIKGTEKLRKGKQPFLYATHRLVVIRIPVKLHDDIPNDYWSMCCTGIFQGEIIKGA